MTENLNNKQAVQDTTSSELAKALKFNEKYEPESSRPSKYYNSKSSFEHFPFSSEQLLKHVRENIDKITNDENRPEKVFYSKVRGVYLYGSRVFNTNVNDSDFDLLFIADDLHSTNSPEGGYSRNTQYNLHCEITVVSGGDGSDVTTTTSTSSYELEVMMMNTSVLLGYADSHLPVILLSVQQPNDKFVVFEDCKMKMWRENWNRWFFRLPKSRNSILHELNFSFNKGHRFWVGLQKGLHTTEKEKKDVLKKVKKNLAHGIRFCKYGYQIAFGGCIYDYLETNDLYDTVVYGTDHYTTWEEYEALVKKLYDRWMVEYKEDIKAVMRESRKACLAMKRTQSSNNLIVSDFLNHFVPTFSKESTFKRNQTNEENITLSFGPFSLNRVFSISVTPLFMENDGSAEDPNNCTLFKFDIDVVCQELENSLSFREMDLYLECNGLIVEAINQQNSGTKDNTDQHYHYRPVCAPRFICEEFDNLDKRFGEGYSNKLNLEEYAIFENPTGLKVNLYYYNNEWRFSFGNESQRWQNEWVLDRDFNSSSNEVPIKFVDLWKKLDMKMPNDQHHNFTFFFTYQKQHHHLASSSNGERIIYGGCRDMNTMKEQVIKPTSSPALTTNIEMSWRQLGEQYNWKDQVKQVVSFHSIDEMKDAINDFNQYSPLLFEGFECINVVNNYKSFQIKSSLRSSIPRMRITNTNYIGSLLDEEIISDPPVELIDSKHNYDTLICTIVNCKFSSSETDDDQGDEQVVLELNRIFLKSYVKLKNSYIALLKMVNEFYSNNLLHLEDQAAQFQEASKLFLSGKIKKANQFFTSFLRFKRKNVGTSVDFSLYWKSLTKKRDNANDLRFIKQLIDINEQ